MIVWHGWTETVANRPPRLGCCPPRLLPTCGAPLLSPESCPPPQARASALAGPLSRLAGRCPPACGRVRRAPRGGGCPPHTPTPA
eukprot:15442008-Alexandrium_andersonii.AAC.1